MSNTAKLILLLIGAAVAYVTIELLLGKLFSTLTAREQRRRRGHPVNTPRAPNTSFEEQERPPTT